MKMKLGTKVTQVVSSAPTDRGRPGVEAAGVAVGAEEGDELHDHDEWAGRGLGEREAVDHLLG
jgi:hypothetical protein